MFSEGKIFLRTRGDESDDTTRESWKEIGVNKSENANIENAMRAMRTRVAMARRASRLVRAVYFAVAKIRR
jgi:fructose-bisphosphate aldolase class 1